MQMAVRSARRAFVRGARSWSLSPLLVLATISLAACGDRMLAPTVPVSGGTPATTSPMTPAPAGPASASALAGLKMYLNPLSPARTQAAAWRVSRPADAAMMDRLADQPIAAWFAEWTPDVRSATARLAAAARESKTIPVAVAYNIPHRDCGLYSAGGVASGAAYRAWIREFAAGLAGGRSIVIVEPDAVAALDCLTPSQQQERLALIADAVEVLKGVGASVYIDAGNALWHSPSEIGARLGRAGLARADGFALNVSNFIATDVSVRFGDALSRVTGGKRYVIDTSRNGMGGLGGSEWCNPSGQAVGITPTTSPSFALVDALLWVKVPGESDGTCNGGPRAGEWWAEYGLGLAKRAWGTVASR